LIIRWLCVHTPIKFIAVSIPCFDDRILLFSDLQVIFCQRKTPRTAQYFIFG
jgi:hypothetical protein